MKKILLWLACCFASVCSIQAQALYGLTISGGNDGWGALIKFTPATNNLTVAKSFESFAANPFYTNFIQASDGKLYGMTRDGGKNKTGMFGLGGGVIFSFDPVSSTYTKLIDFDGTNGANPYGSLLQASDGKLYGMTSAGGSNDSGVIFSYNLLSSTYTKLKDFGGADGTGPNGSLMQASDGKLYGVTGGGGSYSDGVIFSFNPSTSVYTKLKDFGSAADGASPTGSLIQASNGKLYGMTTYGGRGNGVIFSFDPSSSTFTKLMDFLIAGSDKGPSGSLMQASDGKLYGMTRRGGTGYGGIFSYDPSTSVYTRRKDFGGADGAEPWGSLMQAGNGVVFSFDPSTSIYTKLKDFDNTNGANPFGSLMQSSDGKLYGMTSVGGIGNYGVVFSFGPSTSAYTKLKDFEATNGRDPVGSLVQASDGKLYGMTNVGGSGNNGVIFSFNPSTSTYTKLKDFDGMNGRNPNGSLMQASDGKLYGMTSAGGSSAYNGYGVIFSFDPVSSTYTKLKDFNDDISGGGIPTGSLMQASDGKLYGMTSEGGSNNGGVIFSFDPSTSTYTKLKDFDYNTSGSRPFGSLMQASNGKLYGMTQVGGSVSGDGVIFSFEPSTSIFTKLKDFDYPNGTYTFGSLMQANNGKLYGMTWGGGSNDSGVVFSFDPFSSTYTKLVDFNHTNGAYPHGNLMQSSDGKLYGMTSSGGVGNYGVIFSFDPSTSTYTKLKDFNVTNGANPWIGSAFIEVASVTTPVKLLSFSGKHIGASNQLTWKVENEQSLNYYELQRGIDGNHFNAIAQIKAAGNNTYSYNDPIATAASSAYYYRLKSVDKDDRFTYSPICFIRFNIANTNISVSPNPVTRSIRLETSSGGLLTGNSSTATIRIYSSAMQLLQTKKISAADGNTISIPVEKLASGIYYLQLVNGREISVLKFVKE